MDAEEWREQREKMRAEKAATQRPPKPVNEALRRAMKLRKLSQMPTTLAAAVVFGKLVTGPMAEHATKEEIAGVKDRQYEWTRFLQEYQRDWKSVLKNTALTDRQRADVLRLMEASRDERQRELFGE